MMNRFISKASTSTAPLSPNSWSAHQRKSDIAVNNFYEKTNCNTENISAAFDQLPVAHNFDRTQWRITTPRIPGRQSCRGESAKDDGQARVREKETGRKFFIFKGALLLLAFGHPEVHGKS